MPDRIEIYLCKLCGERYESLQEAATCEKMHIKARNLNVKVEVRPQDGLYLYRTRERFPTAIEVWCDQSQKNRVYVLLPEGEEPKESKGYPARYTPSSPRM